MKTVKTTALLLLLSVGFAYSQDVQVQGERRANTDFKKYKTYGWMQEDLPSNNRQLVGYTYSEIVPMEVKETKDKTNPNNNDVVVYTYSYVLPSSDMEVNKTVTKSVDSELEGRGYRKDNLNPDIIVAYKVFDQSSKIKGFSEKPTKLANESEVQQPKDTLTYLLKPGTIMITLLDSKTSDVIWEGSASGVTRTNGVINDKLKIKEAVNLIFRRFEFRADGNKVVSNQ